MGSSMRSFALSAGTELLCRMALLARLAGIFGRMWSYHRQPDPRLRAGVPSGLKRGE